MFLILFPYYYDIVFILFPYRFHIISILFSYYYHIVTILFPYFSCKIQKRCEINVEKYGKNMNLMVSRMWEFRNRYGIHIEKHGIHIEKHAMHIQNSGIHIEKYME